GEVVPLLPRLVAFGREDAASERESDRAPLPARWIHRHHRRDDRAKAPRLSRCRRCGSFRFSFEAEGAAFFGTRTVSRATRRSRLRAGQPRRPVKPRASPCAVARRAHRVRRARSGAKRCPRRARALGLFRVGAADKLDGQLWLAKPDDLGAQLRRAEMGMFDADKGRLSWM